MASSLFSATADTLPAVLPIFPLGQAVVLPGQPLPLNIFEPRYLAMVLDALGQGRHIGMIQPRPATGEQGSAPLYEVGCAGRITAFQEASGDRLVIQLTGACRFRVAEELEMVSGYRRVRPDWSAYLGDLTSASDPDLAVPELEPALRSYAEAHKLELPWDEIGQIERAGLVDMLSAQMPFATEEKQLLLEAPGVVERARLLLGVLAMPRGDESEGTRH